MPVATSPVLPTVIQSRNVSLLEQLTEARADLALERERRTKAEQRLDVERATVDALSTDKLQRQVLELTEVVGMQLKEIAALKAGKSAMPSTSTTEPVKARRPGGRPHNAALHAFIEKAYQTTGNKAIARTWKKLSGQSCSPHTVRRIMSEHKWKRDVQIREPSRKR